MTLDTGVGPIKLRQPRDLGRGLLVMPPTHKSPRIPPSHTPTHAAATRLLRPIHIIVKVDQAIYPAPLIPSQQDEAQSLSINRAFLGVRP